MKPNGDGTKRVRFGAYEVDGAAHELRKRGIKVRVQEQPWEVLCALLERPGELVTREELQKRLWPDGTFVDYDQSLNKAVTKLRDALCDDADKPRYIETVPRKGYRFIGTIDANPEPEPPLPTATPPPPRRRWRWWWWIAGILAAATLITGLWPVPVPQVVRVVQLTNDGRSKSLPMVTDGTRVFYVSRDREVWEVPLAGGEPKQFPLPFLSEQLTKVTSTIRLIQSPLGIRKLILRHYDAVERKNEEDVWTVELDGSSPRKVARIPRGSGYSASPDGASLAISDSGQIRIFRMDPKPASIRFRPGSANPGSLWWHPDGRTIGFVHHGKESKELRIWQVGSDGAHLRRVAPEQEQFQGAGGWSSDGRRFIYYGEDGSPWIRQEPGLLGWMRGAALTRLVPGMGLFGWPLFGGADAKSILQLSRILRGEILRYDRTRMRWEPFAGGFAGDCLKYSPDRRRIAYVKFPGSELRVREADGSGDIVLAPGMLAYNPAWSPDGTRIAFAGSSLTGNDPYTLWTVSAKGGNLRTYAAKIPSGFDPTWSPDGKRLLFAPFLGPPERQKTQILDLESGRIDDVPGGVGYFSTRWSPDGTRILGLRYPDLSLWVFELSSKEWRQVTPEPLGFPEWSEDSRYVYGWYGELSVIGRILVETGKFDKIAERTGFQQIGNLGWNWVGWTPEWEPLVLRDLSTQEVYRIDLDR